MHFLFNEFSRIRQVKIRGRGGKSISEPILLKETKLIGAERVFRLTSLIKADH